jgi:hypothetical protein
MTDYLSVEELGSHSLMGQWGFSHWRAWWITLALLALWNEKPPGTNRMAKHGVWG